MFRPFADLKWQAGSDLFGIFKIPWPACLRRLDGVQHFQQVTDKHFSLP